MQFIRGGPDVPERLLHAHERGKVVFFCGAGVSMPAGLPDFGGLMEQIFHRSSDKLTPQQKTALKNKDYNTAIGLLEKDMVGERIAVRKILAEILTPNRNIPNVLGTHKALLQLGKDADGHTRLVTTNYDRLFEEAAATDGTILHESHVAPNFPIPKQRWNGIVYLHGLLTTKKSESDLNRLVVSSGDLGLAYLSERWASRFLSELFRNFTVCFVGYSINDIVLRYMMDAIAADRLLGESRFEMFAFGGYETAEADCRREWEGKNVTPILYREDYAHSCLHETLRVWAEMSVNPVRWKSGIIAKYVRSNPSMSTREDDFVGRVLWALSDESGRPAKEFAESEPVANLDWLKPLSRMIYRYKDLERYGVRPDLAEDEGLRFSLMSRPSPYTLSPLMSIVEELYDGRRWDMVMNHIAEWLTRHLNNPELIYWILERGLILDERFANKVERQLDRLAKLEREGKTDELEKIKSVAPDAIPGPKMRVIWDLFLDGRIKKSAESDAGIIQWENQFELHGLTQRLRSKLRELLTPCLWIHKPIRWAKNESNASKAETVGEIVESEVVLRSSQVHFGWHKDLRQDQRWKEALPRLLCDFTQLLRETCDLMCELGTITEKHDMSHVHQRSISEHSQNIDYHDWTILIDLTREAWLETLGHSQAQAIRELETWSDIRYPLFRRLVFFAAREVDSLPNSKLLDWLLADEGWWLWAVETRRETMRLIATLSPKLDEPQLARLVDAILKGPPRDIYRFDIEPSRWSEKADRSIWLLLAKIEQAGGNMSIKGRQELDGLTNRYPGWRLSEDQREEFPFYRIDSSELSLPEQTPGKPQELVEWLRENPTPCPWQKDDWEKRCSDDIDLTSEVLCKLAKESEWPIERWCKALGVWSELRADVEPEGRPGRSWHKISQAVAEFPDKVLKELAQETSLWIKTATPSICSDDKFYLQIAERILNLEFQDDINLDEPVTDAINHPIGHITEALIWWWKNSRPGGRKSEDKRLFDIFTQVCSVKFGKFRYGRIMLAKYITDLFRADQNWVEANLLPLFDLAKTPA